MLRPCTGIRIRRGCVVCTQRKAGQRRQLHRQGLAPCLSVRACGAVLRGVAPRLENRKVPLSYKRPKASSLWKTQSVYTGGTEFFSCVKMPTQDLQRIRKYYILEK